MNCIGLMNQEQSTVYLKHATSVYKYAGVLVQTPLKVLHSNSSCANEWEFMIPSPCYLDDFNELLHALLQKDTNSPLTAHEPISNVLGWWIPVLGPVIQWVLHTDTAHSTQTWHGELNRVGKESTAEINQHWDASYHRSEDGTHRIRVMFLLQQELQHQTGSSSLHDYSQHQTWDKTTECMRAWTSWEHQTDGKFRDTRQANVVKCTFEDCFQLLQPWSYFCSFSSYT